MGSMGNMAPTTADMRVEGAGVSLLGLHILR
jgi:hypothetical protein